MPLKVVTVVGTRPEIVKLSCVIPALDKAFQHVLVHTGQNHDYELSEAFFEGLALRKPDHFLAAAGSSAVETIARVLTTADAVLRKERPDALLVLGDTNSCFAALAAKRLRVPVFHMEAGNRCFDERVPEEINRRILDHISDINLPYTEHARRYLVAEGIRSETVIKIGSPMKQVLAAQKSTIARSSILRTLRLTRDRFFVVSAHREENVDDPGRLRTLLRALGALVEAYRIPAMVSTHPRTRARLEALRDVPHHPRVRLLKPFPFADYIRLQTTAACVLSDSGTLTEEAAILGFPAVMLREAHERPEGMDEGVVPMCGIEPGRVLDAVEAVRVRHGRRPRQSVRVADYDVDDVSSKVVNVIRSYTDHVNRVVWRKR